jgi:hypothetical protein
MPAKKYIINLSDEERTELEALTSKGKVSARKMKRAQILLSADDGKKDEEIIAALGVARATVERIRKRCVEGGVEYALNERPRPGGASQTGWATGSPLNGHCVQRPTGRPEGLDDAVIS